MSLKIIVLGTSGGYAGAGHACSGYLLVEGRTVVAMDLGAGALSNMLRYVDPDGLDGLILSHMHCDHFIDVYGLVTARRYWGTPLPPLRVYAPPGAGDHIAALISEENREVFSGFLDIEEIRLGQETRIGNLRVTAARADHIEHSFSFRVEGGGSTICYSGDTGMNERLVELATGVDLLLCESTTTTEFTGERLPGHLSAGEAGTIAAEAGVGRLVLTHIWPTLNRDTALDDAMENFGGQVDLAMEGMIIYAGPFPVEAD